MLSLKATIQVLLAVVFLLGGLWFCHGGQDVASAFESLSRSLVDCSGAEIPTLPRLWSSQAVEAAEVQGIQLYVLATVKKPFGGSETLYGDPEKKVAVRPDGGLCYPYVKLEKQISSRGEPMVHVLGVYEFQGRRLGFWSQSGWVPEASLTTWTNK